MSRLSKETNQIDEVVDVWPERQNDRIVLWRAADEEAQLAEKVVKLGSSETKHRVNTVNLKKMKNNFIFNWKVSRKFVFRIEYATFIWNTDFL
jgi:hypothetical protein